MSDNDSDRGVFSLNGFVRDGRKVVFLIVLIAIGIFCNSLNNPFVLDDRPKIVNNPDIQSLKNLPEKLIYPYESNPIIERNDPSRPLLYLVFTIIYALAGPNPMAFRLVAIFFHVFSSILIFFFLRTTLVNVLSKSHRVAAFFIALFFLVNPIQVGTVIYISGMSDVLSAFFIYLSLYLFVKTSRSIKWTLFLSLLSFVFALMTKQSAVVLPAILLVIDLFLLCDLNWWTAIWNKRKLHGWYWGIAVAYLMWRFLYFGGIGDLEAQEGTHTAFDYAFGQPLVVAKYILLTIFPYGLAIDHTVFPITHAWWAKTIAWLVLLSLIFVAFFSLKRPTPFRKIAAFSLFTYLIFLAPTSSFFPTVDMMVQRRVYPATFAIALFFVAICHILFERTANSRGLIRFITAIAVLSLTIYSSVSVYRNAIFKNEETIWKNVLSIYPDSARGLMQMGKIHFDRNEFDKSKNYYQRGVDKYPNDYMAIGSLAGIYARQDSPYYNPDVAIQYYKKALNIYPKWAHAYYNIGRIRLFEKRFFEAERFYKKAIELNQHHFVACNDLGVLYAWQKKYDAAEEMFKKALSIDPQYKEAKKNLVELYRVRNVENKEGH